MTINTAAPSLTEPQDVSPKPIEPENGHYESESKPEPVTWRTRIGKTHACLVNRFPRIYFFMVDVMLPLFILIGVAFLFGHALATIESKYELDANDEAVRATFTSYAQYVVDRRQVHQAIREAPVQCLSAYDDNATLDDLSANDIEFFSTLFNCSQGRAINEFPLLSRYDYVVNSRAGLPQLTFDWIKCPTDMRGENLTGNTKDTELVQYYAYLVRFRDAYEAAEQKYIESGLTLAEAYGPAVNETTGSEGCTTHTVGGALFWFTLMTTIGYGNAVPISAGGQALVYTCGFISIIAFTALISKASGTILAIHDDLLLRVRLSRLTKGIPAVLFWLCLLGLWILILAGFLIIYYSSRAAIKPPLKITFWLSYISVTTVGFGDYSISHSEFQAGDMFFIPLIILLAFCFLANFAFKLSEVVQYYFPSSRQLEDILATTRRDPDKDVQESLPESTTPPQAMETDDSMRSYPC